MPVLTRDLKAEVLVIGAGVTGALVAEALSTDHAVVVVDRRGAALGATAASTALLSAELDTPLVKLTEMIGEDWAVRAWTRAAHSVATIARRTAELGIPCGLSRRDSLYLAGDVLDGEGLAAETKARKTAGLRCKLLSRQDLASLGIAREAAIASPGHFVVDPRELADGYLLAALRKGARLFAPVDATKAIADGDRIAVATAGGPVILAEHVVYCTGYELPPGFADAHHRRISTYAIATLPQARRHPVLSWIITEASAPYLYLREGPDGRILCGGGDVDFADAAARDRLIPAKADEISHKLGALLPGVTAIPEFAWAGTFGESTTGLPTIASVPGLPNAIGVVGFGGNGMAYAEIAAEIIAERLAGKNDPDTELYASV